jgi:hypothetical protein
LHNYGGAAPVAPSFYSRGENGISRNLYGYVY